MLLLNLFHNPIYFIAFIIALLVGITVHEFAHAWAADRSGDPTPRLDGRLSLNPFVHLDLLGSIFLLLVGFGWGKPVMINPHNFRERKDELKVAIAGIVANIILAFLLAIPIRVALMQGHTIDSSLALSFLNIIVDINLVLAAFNILPIFPLDGSHFVEYFIGEEAKVTYRQVGPFLLLGLILYGQFTGNSILFTVMEPILRLFSFLVKGVFTFSV